MMETNPGARQYLPVLIAAAVGVIILAGIIGTCVREPAVNSELARAVRTAVESADEARRQNDSAYLWPGRLRLIAIVVGVTVPLLAAVVLVYLATRHKADDLEVAAALQKHRLLPPAPPLPPKPALEQNPKARLPADSEHSSSAQQS